MDEKKIIEMIKAYESSGEPLSSQYVGKNHPDVFQSAKEIFGDWKTALKEANIQGEIKWNKLKVIKMLQLLSEEDLVARNLRIKYRSLYNAAIRLFGSRKNAFDAADINYEETLMNIPWTKDRVINAIQTYYLNNIPLNFKFINAHYSNLRQKADKFFGSWGEAVSAAGLNYEEIKKNKGIGNPFLGEDGVLYTSQLEGLIADQLYELKNDGKILGYQTQQLVTPGYDWICDFTITLLNGAKFYLETDSQDEKKRKAKRMDEKIKYYEKANFFFYKVSSHNNIKNIIERYTSWFTLPVEDCIITTHKDPDGDALSSSIAIYKYIIKNGKQAAIRISGEAPKNLQWMLSEDINFVKKVPEWAKMLYVLDCAPMKNRLGWDPPQLPVYNIDHHFAVRGEFNDPDNNVHIIEGCSTASLLSSRFGLNDKILVVGVYTDTLFTKHIYEVLHFISQNNIREDDLSSYISKINAASDKKLWDLLFEAKIHRCKNGFVFVETESDYSPDIIEGFMQILMKLNESVCLIYGKEKVVKLRTSNPSLDVSEIAKEYGGGGHKYASMCSALDKVSEFKSRIISIIRPEPETDESQMHEKT